MYRYIKEGFLLTILFLSYQTVQSEQKEIIIVIPSYNNIEWYQRNLDSVIHQNYSNWKAYYIDDCSSDGTGIAVAKYIHDNNINHRITLIQNKQRRGALYNLYTIITQCPDHAVIVTIDGDDWLANNNVLERINTEYSQQDAWMTYGQYQVYPDGSICCWRPVPDYVIQKNSYRENPWYTSHLRTFYAWLFKKIKKKDLMHNDEFFSVTWDMAFMFPMLEMAGAHAHHIPEVLYMYNQATPINDYKIRLPLVLEMDKVIRSKEKYKRIK